MRLASEISISFSPISATFQFQTDIAKPQNFG